MSDAGTLLLFLTPGDAYMDEPIEALAAQMKAAVTKHCADDPTALAIGVALVLEQMQRLRTEPAQCDCGEPECRRPGPH